eukprot:CAMPEP_0196764374 /NCGR_PEP_ID=MMETSP1095-20130614/5961_1 /TAXON_ID=96789 ORGANISM="Chromulina nebulosa, Strain UTEXLB2642" /NCGR_SAMPLE_ID=MMETSP1095 /ASSEMBLY_ACC=CAM_ASM_000446 /LENGTH=460 /DNA_ID=CAMNT_0042119749 /DNA_START=525 /DNA_END=1903 /DNA_ORIENTATION=+
MKNEKYDHIVVECSGIAEPRKIRELFHEAEDFGLGLLNSIQLDTLVTIVDAKLFFETFGSDENLSSKADLAYKPTDFEGRKNLLEDGSGQRSITELLLEQVECADVVLINKCDLLANENQIKLVENVIYRMNPTARVITCTNGEVPNPVSILGSAGADGAASWGILDEHRKLIEAVENSNVDNHSHDDNCHDSNCTDPSHNHDHDDKICEEVNCTDPSHSHTHSSHSHEHSDECHDVKCNDPTHNHSHDEHSHCEPECKDPTHNHDHSHSHSHGKTTAEERFGITSFVYKRRRPFHPIRLSKFLQSVGKLSVTGMTDVQATALINSANGNDNIDLHNDVVLTAKKALLRSKGFVWMASSTSAAYFMSHAGQYLELLILGRWWADIDVKEWPVDMTEEIKLDFSGDYGDRRQELVFIGQFGTTSGNSRKALEEALDSCLLTDKEMELYNESASQGDAALRA